MPPRPSPTHFLCIPLATAACRRQLSASLASFKSDVTSADSFGVPEEAVRPLGTLHLTLGVFSFPRNEGLENAVALLKTIIPRQILADVATPTSASAPAPPVVVAAAVVPSSAEEQTAAGGGGGTESSITPPSLSVTLKGLRTMQTAAKATVLYAPPINPFSSSSSSSEEGRIEDSTLYEFCAKLRTTFQDAGVMEKEDRPLLLHATIVNTIYVKKGKGKGASRGKRERLTIDARQILDRYADHVWLRDAPVEKIAICKMGAQKLADGDEAYEVEAEIDVA